MAQLVAEKISRHQEMKNEPRETKARLTKTEDNEKRLLQTSTEATSMSSQLGKELKETKARLAKALAAKVKTDREAAEREASITKEKEIALELSNKYQAQLRERDVAVEAERAKTTEAWNKVHKTKRLLEVANNSRDDLVKEMKNCIEDFKESEAGVQWLQECMAEPISELAQHIMFFVDSKVEKWEVEWVEQPHCNIVLEKLENMKKNETESLASALEGDDVVVIDDMEDGQVASSVPPTPDTTTLEVPASDIQVQAPPAPPAPDS